MPFSNFHKKRDVNFTLKARLLDADDFGLANQLCLCKGARVLLTRKLWVDAGLVTGAQEAVGRYVWPMCRTQTRRRAQSVRRYA